jgi:hypothetical protein
MKIKVENPLVMSSFLFSEGAKSDKAKGVIYDAAIVTEGEAKGHGVNLDSEFVGKVVELAGKKSLGIKVRFGHPSMSGNALGTFVGRAKNFRTAISDKGKALARADIHLSETAAESPNGNLYDYVLSMAESEADMFGMSIVFRPGKTYVRKDGQKIYDHSEFSADGCKLRKKEYKDLPLFVECEQLHAADLVDEPAANDNGLFDTATWAEQASEFLDSHPEIYALAAANPDMVKSFLARYEDYRKRLSDTNKPDIHTTSEQENIMEKNKNLEVEFAQTSAALKDAEGRLTAFAEQVKTLTAERDELKAKHEALSAEQAKQAESLQASALEINVLKDASVKSAEAYKALEESFAGRIAAELAKVGQPAVDLNKAGAAEEDFSKLSIGELAALSLKIADESKRADFYKKWIAPKLK